MSEMDDKHRPEKSFVELMAMSAHYNFYQQNCWASAPADEKEEFRVAAAAMMSRINGWVRRRYLEER